MCSYGLSYYEPVLTTLCKITCLLPILYTVKLLSLIGLLYPELSFITCPSLSLQEPDNSMKNSVWNKNINIYSPDFFSFTPILHICGYHFCSFQCLLVGHICTYLSTLCTNTYKVNNMFYSHNVTAQAQCTHCVSLSYFTPFSSCDLCSFVHWSLILWLFAFQVSQIWCGWIPTPILQIWHQNSQIWLLNHLTDCLLAAKSGVIREHHPASASLDK